MRTITRASTLKAVLLAGAGLCIAGTAYAAEPLVKTWSDGAKKTGVDPDAALSELKASLKKYNALAE